MNIERKLSKLLKGLAIPHQVQVFFLKILYALLHIKSSRTFSIRKIIRSLNFSDQYKIEGAINLDGHSCFGNPKTYPAFQKEFELFKSTVIQFVQEKRCATFYKFGDGDYHFLKMDSVGSALPGKRAISKEYHEINHQEFVDGVLKNDYITVEIYPENRKMFSELYPERTVDYPAEYGYALIANKWFFKQFKGKIGLIGAKEKLQLIERLLQYDEYKAYLEIDKFNDYIYVPQKFACDDIDSLEHAIGEQLKNSDSDIFLIGIGHVKSAVLHRFKQYKNAVYIDVGSGIDALSGCINIQRPYAGDWTNFRIQDYDYSKIDYLQYHGAGKHIILDH